MGLSSISVYKSHGNKRKEKPKKSQISPRVTFNSRMDDISYDPYNMMDYKNDLHQTELHSSPVSFTPYPYNSVPKTLYSSEDIRYQQYYEFSDTNLNERYPLGKSTGSESSHLGTKLLNLATTVIITDPESNSFHMINAHCHQK